jgi:alkylhydroperoxidase/carboxymuconolactone decarboxylase family protein YurZ
MPSEAEVRARIGPGHPYDFGFIPGMMRLITTHGRIAPLFGALFQQIRFAPGKLDRREREMVAATAAAAQDCHY